MENVSVVLASYNGGKYIKEQVDSMLEDLHENDEVIVSDDGSSDETIKIINEVRDSRIKIVLGPKKGFVRNFENAVSFCKNEYIFFCDQDDIWLRGKRDIVLAKFNEKINVVKHDAIVVDENLHTIAESYNKILCANDKYYKNFIKNTFTGCCMCVRKSFLNKILPTPEHLYHDLWISILACKRKTACIIDDKLIMYRRHGNNVSSMKRGSIFSIIRKRFYLYQCVRRVKI